MDAKPLDNEDAAKTEESTVNVTINEVSPVKSKEEVEASTDKPSDKQGVDDTQQSHHEDDVSDKEALNEASSQKSPADDSKGETEAVSQPQTAADDNATKPQSDSVVKETEQSLKRPSSEALEVDVSLGSKEDQSRKRRLRRGDEPGDGPRASFVGSPNKWRLEDTSNKWKETISSPRGQRRGGRRQSSRSAVLAQRRHCCPFLLRVYATTKGVANEEELQVYTWLSATLREIVNLVKDVLPEVRDPSVRLHMKIRSHKTSQLTDIGTLSSAYQSAVDRRSLVSYGFKIGDIIHVELDGSKSISREEIDTADAEVPHDESVEGATLSKSEEIADKENSDVKKESTELVSSL